MAERRRDAFVDVTGVPMPTTIRRSVFTGLGLLTPIGSDPATFWQSLCAGTSGIRPIRSFNASALCSTIAGEVPNFEPKKIVPKDQRKGLNRMARAVQLGFAAAVKAWEDGKGPMPGQIDPFRFGVEFGCVMVATDLEDLTRGAKRSATGKPGGVNLQTWGAEGLREVPPQWMLKYLPNMPACHTSILVDAQGPNNTITEGDAAGLLALGEAYRILNRDLADAFLVGGCDSKLNPLSLTRHSTFQQLSKRNDMPTEALRPFDADRDGTVLGEGAGVVGLEELSFAMRRGAPIIGELVGFASGFDRGRKGSIFAGVIRHAIKESGIQLTDVDHVNAAAGGWVEQDAWEARAIHEVFGTTVPVFAPKGHLGNLGAAAGLVELTASILALRHGQLPGTLNHVKDDPACPVSVSVGPPRPVTKHYAVKLAFTDWGQCAAAVVRKWDG
jgi:3-oxoacyl-[acyl-carrier-protein] synthase II